MQISICIGSVFLALRLAAVEDAVDQGASLLFLANDLFINYDDERAAAGFCALASLGPQTRALFFTHREYLLGVAEAALAPDHISRCTLPTA